MKRVMLIFLGMIFLQANILAQLNHGQLKKQR
ncbi:unnamed protein product, partial [marine sediment metagenome]